MKNAAMKNLVWSNVAFNTAFIVMAFSEMTGATNIHETLPWWFKWWWIVALAAGNLFIHILQLRSLSR